MCTSALDYATFEDWAEDTGFDADSRSAERIYNACMAMALKIRAAIGGAGLGRLKDAAQDY